MEKTNSLSKDEVLAELMAMGFEFLAALQAVETVGQSVGDAVEFILAGDPVISHQGGNISSNNQNKLISTHSREEFGAGQNIEPVIGLDTKRQSLITEKFKPSRKHDKSGSSGMSNTTSIVDENGAFEPCGNTSCTSLLEETELNWEKDAEIIVQRYFGHTELKCFQKEALKAWAAHQDCLVLAATGSGKSLCFQLPALMTGKVVVVVSPLISLMHDQCLKLARHGVSACFLGSGQVDKSVEDRAMKGMYSVVYVCPETLPRIIDSLQRLVENRGIALFAIDEVHCVSKWGHDFRPAYRRLLILREKFKASNFKSLEYDIPIMALTATATHRVREDILCSLGIKATAKIVLTSFFRPNLRFLVHHSNTSQGSSYEMDFQELIIAYTKKKGVDLSEKNSKTGVHLENVQHVLEKKQGLTIENSSDSDTVSSSESDTYMEETDNHNCDVNYAATYGDEEDAYEGQQMTAEYLEDENDEQMVEDFDVTFGEFKGSLWEKDKNLGAEYNFVKAADHSILKEENSVLGLGPSIIYTPTRKETGRLANFLCKFGVKAAAYHAKLPKKHLHNVHDLFHNDSLQVVVATVAFGMGIDKSNVRQVIHYGWPQSLEAYYQEAGRAGRDGLLADCTLYADMTRLPSLLPSRRDAEQTQNALSMLSDCFRYGVSTTCCRAKTLVQYFGEDLIAMKCGICDICIKGPPKCENLIKEAEILLRVLVELQSNVNYGQSDLNNKRTGDHHFGRCSEMVSFKEVIERVIEQHEEGRAKGRLWWRGFGRMLEDIGYIREVAMQRNQGKFLTIKNPEPTVLGLEFLKGCDLHHMSASAGDHSLSLFPEGDMLQAMKMQESTSGNSEWGRGWADTEIRQQRLKGRKRRKKRKRASRKPKQNLNTVRGRLSAKISKKKK
ncbi:ATP-dependent DNA helicase Q-like SIM isoform X1 [Cryptomeria japonica]|uniref:ATP-dependent DNA helicase Q-like SIM isoform X1 n=1 Tax=Cryptomeria japonica TaxID=3369 RepID=UPI0027DA61AA|nr:ATP-dependent DNA helicase Q-like SIM isoform X1 [Cryptomeria japonica]